LRRTLLLFLGWVLVVLGALSLFGALLQGLLLLAIGLYALSFEQPWMRDQRARLERRYPEAARHVQDLEAKARGLYRRTTGEDPGDGSDRRGGR
jgi:hypothetical protein